MPITLHSHLASRYRLLMVTCMATLCIGGAVLRSVAETSPDTEATVELSADQVETIKIEQVGTYMFPNEKEEVGTISFEEAPNIVQDESALIGAAATFVLTSKELARARDLYASSGAVAQREMEQAVSDQQTAAAALKAARETVQADGKTDAEIDQMVAAGKIDLTQAADTATKWVVANVPESDLPLFRVGQTVRVTVMAYPDRVFEGSISKIYATVDPNTHRVAIRCKVTDNDDELRAGMLANFVIRYHDPLEATAIPENGVVREGDGTLSAWVTTDRRHFSQRKVKIGMLRDGRYEVIEGLQRGELAVTDGAVFLSNILAAPPED